MHNLFTTFNNHYLKYFNFLEMRKRIFRNGLILFFILSKISTQAQEYFYPLNRDMDTRIGVFVNEDKSGFHTSMKPYTNAELKKIAPLDSIWQPILKPSKFYNTWVGRKLRKEHFINVNEDDILLSIDPVFNFQLGRDQKTKRNVYVNSRGLMVQGNVKDNFFFYTQFHENQARYVNYISNSINRYDVAPGQGKVKFLPDDSFDFSQATGGIAYTLNKHFDFLLASDKNFIGDGYRSLLLSDNAYSYPFLRINMTFWKFKYTVLYAIMQDLQTPHDPNVGYDKKYSTTHYLDINIGKKNKVSVGIFETVMFKQAASRGYELSYLNPMLFLRPVENSLDSPDNVLLGLNTRWKINGHNTIYSQIMLDEFLLSEVRAGNGWWGNKQGLQLGYKSSDIFSVKSLNFQTEFNFVRPFTYQHRSNGQNYTHHNQALAHPLGADFIESVTFLNYRWRNFFAEIKFQYAKMGQNIGTLNLGNDIFESYETRAYEYGNYMFNGLESKLNSFDFRIDYLVNPKTNFNIEIGTVLRKFSYSSGQDDSQLFYFGIRTSLENYYFDF